jgi:hypothetical protein
VSAIGIGATIAEHDRFRQNYELPRSIGAGILAA